MKLKKGAFYVGPTNGGFSMGTYIGRFADGKPAFSLSPYSQDRGLIHLCDPTTLVEIPPEAKNTETEVFRFLLKVLPE